MANPNRHPSNRIGKHRGTKPAFTAQGNVYNQPALETRSLGYGYYCIIDVARTKRLESDIQELKPYVKELVDGSKGKDRKSLEKTRGKGDSA